MNVADRAARERKQKIFVAVGGLLLLAMLAFELPHYLGGSSSSSGTPATTTTPTDASSGDAASSSSASATPGVAAPAAPVSLASAARPLTPQPGQLSNFSTFPVKDPFVQQVKFSDSSSSGSSPGGAAGKGVAGSGKETTKAPAPSKQPKAASQGFSVGGGPTASATVISVNGVRQALVAGTAFPASNPVFVLVSESLKTKSVVVGIAGGAYASGAKTTKLVLGKPLVLVNTTTGARYKLMLVAVGNGLATPKGTTPGAGGSTDSSSSGSPTPSSTPSSTP
jgi:hypothetical protein